MSRTAVICGLLAVLFGCSGDDDAGSPSSGVSAVSSFDSSASSPGEADKKPWDEALGTATVSGVVRLEGDPPRRRPIDMAGKAECTAVHTEPILDETVIVGPGGSLKNVIVWVKKGLGEWSFPKPTEAVVLDQRGCRFRPHVVAVQVGQDVLIRNSDSFAHNVHAIPNRNQPFNFTQGQAGAEDVRTFSRPELMTYIKCDIHGWMSAYVNVMPHPFFVVTKEDGTFELPKLPPGEYTIEAQHELFGKQSMVITLGDGESQSDVEFAFRDEETP